MNVMNAAKVVLPAHRPNLREQKPGRRLPMRSQDDDSSYFREVKSMQSSHRSNAIPSLYLSFLLLILALFASSGVARAQLSGKGELKGTVTDPSGAVVANATVTAVQ